MRGYLSVPDGGSGTVTVDSRVEVYRDPDGSQEIIARTTETECALGIKDVTVSRRKQGTAPVVIEPRQSMVEIHNNGNSNGVTVVSDGDETQIDEGLSTTVDDTAKITIGYQTTLRLRVEREAKTEVNVGEMSGGNVVAGDQKNIDESTHVVDSVVNRSDIGSGSGGAEVDDSVVNRSQVGGDQEQDNAEETDTQQRCDIHDRLYTGSACPACEAETRSNNTQVETKFCMFCGEDIPKIAAICPECGEELPDAA